MNALWRNRWQVVRYFTDDIAKKLVVCSHRWSWTAELCSDWRDRALLRAGAGVEWHDVRRTPNDREPGSLYWMTFDQLAHTYPQRSGAWLRQEAAVIVEAVEAISGAVVPEEEL